MGTDGVSSQGQSVGMLPPTSGAAYAASADAIYAFGGDLSDGSVSRNVLKYDIGEFF